MQNLHQTWTPMSYHPQSKKETCTIQKCTHMHKPLQVQCLVTHLQGEPRALQIVNLILISGKAMEQLILETIPRYNEGKKNIKSNQHDFTKVKSWQMEAEQSRLSTWTSVKSWTQSHHNIHPHKLLMDRLDKHTVRWTESCLNSLWSAEWSPVGGQEQQCTPRIDTVLLHFQ